MTMTEAYSPATIPLASDPSKLVAGTIPYSDALATEILDHYMDGLTLKEITKLPGMPPDKQLRRWLANHEGFRSRVQSARATKALLHEERALYLAERAVAEAPQEQHVAAHRLGFDAHKWAAEINDPARYGKKTTIQGDPDRPIQFIVSTGFPAPNASQTHPELGSDGLIIKEAVTVAAEVEHAHDGPREAVERDHEEAGPEPESLFERLTRENAARSSDDPGAA